MGKSLVSCFLTHGVEVDSKNKMNKHVKMGDL